MGKYEQDALELLRYIGGKENIIAVTHCMTRMRFALQDPAKADLKKIEALKSVKGSFTQAGQFQIIIGNDVSDFYDDFVKLSGIEGVSKENVKHAAMKNQNIIQRGVATIAEIFAPLIPAIIVGGLILGFRNCIDSLYLFNNGTQTLCDISQFWKGMDSFLWLIGEAVFHTGIPVGICWSVSKKMGTTPMLGIVLGLTLISGQLLNAYAVASTPVDKIPVWNFDYFQVHMIGYQAQVIPAILAAFTLAYLERFFKKITPQVISMIVVPFASLLLAVVAAHFILGPIGWAIGSVISKVVYAGITGPARILFGAIFGFIYAPLVITGLHHMTNAIDMQLIADYGGTMLWPMIALSNIAQGSAVLSMIFLQRGNASKQEVNMPACLSCYLGVTEPAMFGVNLKYTFPFLSAMTGSACAGAFAVSAGVTANAIGVGGLPGILSIKPQSMLPFAIAMLIAIVVPFILTTILGKKKHIAEADLAAETDIAEEAHKDISSVKSTSTINLKAFCNGKIVKLVDVNDGVFSKGIVGQGIAIQPAAKDNTIYAPASGSVVALSEVSKHACGIRLENGTEILIHVGLDTVELNGLGFDYLVKQGQIVQQGEALMKFDSKKITDAGKKDIVICVITEPGPAKDFKFTDQTKAVAKETDIVSFCS